MGKPDALSCQADHGSGQNDNDNMTLLSPELFCVHVLSAIALSAWSVIFSGTFDAAYKMISKRSR
jgi:hypothetical protein